jgi:hypothetical protein
LSTCGPMKANTSHGVEKSESKWKNMVHFMEYCKHFLVSSQHEKFGCKFTVHSYRFRH